MRRTLLSAALVTAALVTSPAPAAAHNSILLLSTPSAKKGEPVTLLFLWGHPFERQFFDAEKPVLFSVRTPSGKIIAGLAGQLEKRALPAGGDRKATAFRFVFTPEERGDYLFFLQAQPMWLKEEEKFYQDRVHVILHVAAQVGWDKPAEPSTHYSVNPLTRPYGLLPGSVFQAEVTEGSRGKPVPNALVEVERYSAKTPASLPAEEFVTRTVKTGPNGVFTTDLPDAGWWVFTTGFEDGTLSHMNKKYPLYRRTLLWVFVDEKAK